MSMLLLSIPVILCRVNDGFSVVCNCAAFVYTRVTLYFAGVASDLKEKAVSLLTPSNDIFQEINVSGDTFTLKSVTPLWTREHTGKFGESFNEPDLEGKGQLTVSMC